MPSDRGQFALNDSNNISTKICDRTVKIFESSANKRNKNKKSVLKMKVELEPNELNIPDVVCEESSLSREPKVILAHGEFELDDQQAMQNYYENKVNLFKVQF